MVDYLMKHKGLSIAILALCLLVVVVCMFFLQQGQEVTAKAEFEAIVLENDTQLLVEPVEGSPERNSSDQIVLHLPQALDTARTACRLGVDAVLVQDISVENDVSTALWTCIGYTVLLCFTLFKSSSVAKSIFNAH